MNTYEYDIAWADGTQGTYQIKAESASAADSAVGAMMNQPGAKPAVSLSRMRLAAVAPGPRFTVDGAPDTNFTVEEASRFLTCWQPLPVGLLGKLGKDCSMVCRIRDSAWTERPTPTKTWLKERAYPFEIIREVFELNPDTAPYIPR